MNSLLFVVFFSVTWAGGIYMYGKAAQGFADKNYTMTLVSLVLTAALAAAVYFFFYRQFIAVLLGVAAALFIVVDPFGLTAEKASEIGREYRREKALKEQKEDQEREDAIRRRENERFYREAVKEMKQRDSKK